MNPKEVVESGYDRIHKLYHVRRTQGFWSNKSELDDFMKLLPEGASILDAGCGSGYVARILADHGFDVTGVDISRNMLKLARKSSPESKFLRMDMADLKLPVQSFEGVICLYAIIHVPRRSHLRVLRSFRHMLKPGGILAIHMGWDDYVGIEEDWLGHGVPLYWSHFDRETNLALLAQAGFQVISSRASKQKDGTHLFVIAAP